MIAILVSFVAAALWWIHIIHEYKLEEFNRNYEACVYGFQIFSAIGFSLVFLLLMILKGFSII